MVGPRRWIIVPTLIATVASAGSDSPTKADQSLPLNVKAAAYARAQVGRQVGDGQCSTLVVAALQFAGARPGWFGFPHHTAVVAKVGQDGQVITIHHQNVNVNGQGQGHGDGNKVREDELRMDALQPGGWIKAYRPVEPARSKRRR